jgi:predicted metalloprotease
MRWQGGRRGGGIDDRRGMGAGGVIGGGLGVAVLAFLGMILFDIDPNITTQVATQLGMGQGSSSQGDIGSPDDPAAHFVEVIQTSTTDVWSQLMPGYEQPQVVIYEGGTGTACGLGQAAMGPFYCPLDRQVYLDLGFWNTMSQQLGASGDFAQAYVIAHEVGHHVQTLDGTADRVRQAQSQARSQAEANQWQVAMELQADCYAGVWAARVGQASNGQVDPGGRRHRRGAECRLAHRRRCAVRWPGQPRELHPRLVRTARRMAAPRPAKRRPGPVRHLQLGPGLTAARSRDTTLESRP